jgi:hypothetical protein
LRAGGKANELFQIGEDCSRSRSLSQSYSESLLISISIRLRIKLNFPIKIIFADLNRNIHEKTGSPFHILISAIAAFAAPVSPASIIPVPQQYKMTEGNF